MIEDGGCHLEKKKTPLGTSQTARSHPGISATNLVSLALFTHHRVGRRFEGHLIMFVRVLGSSWLMVARQKCARNRCDGLVL